MDNYKSYLAARILNEDKQVTYRLLSRALKVHVNTAKQMLYEFHRIQNGKKPGSVHATYLLSGTKREEPLAANDGALEDGEDVHMQSSPFMSSSMPQPEETVAEAPVLTIELVREEDLEAARGLYTELSSIHIYSLGPTQLKDLNVLSDVNCEIKELCANEDPLETGKIYGTIINKQVRRRTGPRPPPPAAAPIPKPQPVKPKASESKTSASTTASKQEAKSQPSSAKDFFGKGKEKAKVPPNTASNPSSQEPSPNPPTLKRDSSSIFKAFAKSKPKLKEEGTDSSAAASPAPATPADDSPMRDVSDDEEETYVPPQPKASAEIVDKDRKSRKQREEELKKMMEEDDEDEPMPPPPPDVEEAEETNSKEASVEPKENAALASSGRRRGRRRVTKKKTVRDEDGYLVTKEEPVWESFSEDEEVAPAKPKAQAQPSSTTAKPKKGAAKAGQGNIMAFFGKK